jgi:hypothetical protein
LRRHDAGIGNGYFLVFGRADANYKRRFFHHIALNITNFNAVAHFERAHVSKH